MNYAGLALIALGIAMMVGEMLVPSFGALGIGGIIAFVVGSIMLMDTDLPGFGISWQVVGGRGARRGAPADADDRHAGAQPAARRGRPARRRWSAASARCSTGATARAASGSTARSGRRAARPGSRRGSTVRITAIQGLTLEVEPDPSGIVAGQHQAGECGMPFILNNALILIPVALIVVFLFAAIRVIREYERAVVFQLGRFWKVKGPGLILVIPVIQQAVKVDLGSACTTSRARTSSRATTCS